MQACDPEVTLADDQARCSANLFPLLFADWAGPSSASLRRHHRQTALGSVWIMGNSFDIHRYVWRYCPDDKRRAAWRLFGTIVPPAWCGTRAHCGTCIHRSAARSLRFQETKETKDN